MRYLISSALLALVSLGPGLAEAQDGPSAADRATARRLATEGQIALKKGDWDTAADRFDRANDLLAAPTFLVRLARARAGQGRLVEAYEIYRKIIREGVAPDQPDAFKRALAEAKQEVKAVEPRLAWVSINVKGANPNVVEVQLNNAVIPSAALGAQRPVDPGTLHARARADGYRTAQADVQLAEGEHLPAIELVMVAQPKAERTIVVGEAQGPVMTADGGEPAFISQSTLGYLTLGLGGAGLALGGITGFMAFKWHSDLVDLCKHPDESPCHVYDPNDTLRPAALKKQHDMKRYASVATIGFIAGGALAATGLILLITAPDKPGKQAEAASFRPYVGLGTIGAVGSF
jgi:tetratricopeptide (TPR) repeat protein